MRNKLKMNTLKDIKSYIVNLSSEEIYELSVWLQDHIDDSWDKQMKDDAELGKLDRILEKVNSEINNNQVKPLNEILNDPSPLLF